MLIPEPLKMIIPIIVNERWPDGTKKYRTERTVIDAVFHASRKRYFHYKRAEIRKALTAYLLEKH